MTNGRDLFVALMAAFMVFLASFVGDDFDGKYICKYSGTVTGVDGWIYGVSSFTNVIVKYDPLSDMTSRVGEEHGHFFFCGDGVLARGCIYAFNWDSYDVLKIDTVNNSYSCINTSSIEYDGSLSWFGATLGCDGYVYWPPCTSSHILKYDPEKEYASLVGTDFGLGAFKWNGGSLAHDGVIYCIPRNATEVLSIDPFGGFKSKLREDVEQYPNKLGLLFEHENEGTTAYESAVSKYGKEKAFEAVVEVLSSASTYKYDASNIYPIIVAASCPDSDLSIIFHLLCKIPSSIIDCETDLNSCSST